MDKKDVVFCDAYSRYHACSYADFDRRRCNSFSRLSHKEDAMENKNNDIKLYNVLFPFWMLLLFPQMWAIVLPGNFIIDSIVLIISMFALKMTEKKRFYKRHIFQIWGFGMLSDIVGAAYMFLLMWAFEVGSMGDELYLTIPALIISAALIFVLNYFVTFRKSDKVLRLKLALAFTIVTAPYTFLIPSSWLY